MGNLPIIPPTVLRQPPAPPRNHRSLITGDVPEGNTEMVGGNSTCTYYLRRCKRKRLTNIDSLPDDLLFKILVNLPAQDIYEQARLVCRKWYHTIRSHNFIYAHLGSTTYGLLFECLSGSRVFTENPVFMALRQGRIEISKYSYKFRLPMWASCNGSVLEFDLNDHSAVYITNPATKQMFLLPPFFSVWKHLFGIAYAAVSMEYKVVVTHDLKTHEESKRRQCAILTIGVDKSWRNVPTEHLSLTSKKALYKGPLITEGFIHWALDDSVLTLNVETEIITETPAPIPQVYGRKNLYYLSTGRYLSLLIIRGKNLWEVWEMKPETGEWRKLPNIASETQKHGMEQFAGEDDDILKPVGWLKYPEVLIFVAVTRQGGFFICVTFLMWSNMYYRDVHFLQEFYYLSCSLYKFLKIHITN